MSQHDSDANTNGTMNDDPMTDERFADVQAALGLAVAPVAPSAGLKASVMEAIARTPQVAPLAPVSAIAPVQDAAAEAPRGSAAARAEARWFSRPALVVTAAAAAVALFFGGVAAAGLVNPTAPTASDQLAAIVAAPDVETVASPVADGGSATLVSSESLGVSAMVFEGLPELDADEAYALWYITDGEPTPAGLFTVESDGDGQVVQVLDGAFEAGTIVGVTVEPASGSPAPTTTPIVAIPTEA